MYKRQAKDSDTTVTGRSIGGPVRVLKNKMAREYLALEKRGATLEELERVTLGGLRRAVFEGDTEHGSVMAGQDVYKRQPPYRRCSAPDGPAAPGWLYSPASHRPSS